MPTIKNWSDDLKGFTDEKLVRVLNAFDVLRTWDMHRTAYPETNFVRLMIIEEQNNRK